MLIQLVGAIVRAILLVLLVATPALMLPGGEADHIVSLFCIALGALILAEYTAVYPGLIEFRDAPPYNRIRFLSAFAMLFGLSAVARYALGDGSALALILTAVGHTVASALDLPFSPVRLMLINVAQSPDPMTTPLLHAMLGLSALLSTMAFGIFLAVLRLLAWPASDGALNVWTNLPLFDPTGGGDVAERLRKSAAINLSLGFLTPFAVPLAIGLGGALLWPPSASAPQSMVWMVALWALGPLWFFMRGVALHRVADMIEEKRRAQGTSLALS